MIVNQNILAILKEFLILPKKKKEKKNSTPSQLPQLLLSNFLAKFTEFSSKIFNRKKISNEHFVSLKYLLMFHNIYKFWKK